jgi:hypothetical protein
LKIEFYIQTYNSNFTSWDLFQNEVIIVAGKISRVIQAAFDCVCYSPKEQSILTSQDVPDISKSFVALPPNVKPL